MHDLLEAIPARGPSYDELVARFARAEQWKNAAIEAYDALRTELIARTGVGNELAGEHFIVTCAEVERRVTDYKAIITALEIPSGVIEKHTKLIKYPTLRVDYAP